MKKIILILTLLLAFVIKANAQNYALEILNDKKVINVQKLGLPSSTTIQQVLHMLPELLARPGVDLVNNYSITINDAAVDDLSDAVVTQLRIIDVDQIEITESATASLDNMGEGGTINIILNKGDATKKFQGNVKLDTAYPNDIMPGIHLLYKPNNWSIRTLFKGDYYDPSATTTETWYDAYPEKKCYKSNDFFFGQLGRIYADYTTDKHVLNITLGESSSYQRTTFEASETAHKIYSLFGHAKYQYNFTKATNLMVEGEYSYHPDKTSQTVYMDENTSEAEKHNDNNNLSAHFEFTHDLMKNDFQKWSLIFGTTYNHVWNYLPASIETSNHLLPYVKVDAKVGKWTFLTEVDYQYFNYSNCNKETHEELSDYKPSHVITGMAAASWQFTPHQMLRFVADRKIQRQNSFTLVPIKLNSWNLDYITDINGSADSWIIDVGAGFIHVTDVYPNGNFPYDNSNMWHLNAMCRYQRGIMTTSFTANVYYNKRKHNQDETQHDVYYNFSLMPAFNFKYDINFAIDIIYNSPVDQRLARKGQCFYSRLTLGKDFHHWNIHLYSVINFLGKTTDMQQTDYGMQYTRYNYDVIRNSIGAGVRYSF